MNKPIRKEIEIMGDGISLSYKDYLHFDKKSYLSDTTPIFQDYGIENHKSFHEFVSGYNINTFDFKARIKLDKILKIYVDNKLIYHQGILIIPIGIQASGKTHFYHKYLSKLFQFVSKDEIRRKILHSKITKRFYSEKKESKVMKKFLQLFEEKLNNNENIFLDGTNLTKIYRKFFIENAKKKGYKIITCYFDVPFELCLKRNNQRNEKKVRKVPIDVMENCKQDIQFPERNEFDLCIVFDENLDCGHGYFYNPESKKVKFEMGFLNG